MPKMTVVWCLLKASLSCHLTSHWSWSSWPSPPLRTTVRKLLEELHIGCPHNGEGC